MVDTGGAKKKAKGEMADGWNRSYRYRQTPTVVLRIVKKAKIQ